MKDNLTQLAMMFKSRENKEPSTITKGTVISPPPAIKVQINDSIILDEDHLIFSSFLLNGYIRNAKINGSQNSIQFLDYLIQGDEVILIPTADGQTYFVIDKAVSL